MNSAWTGRSGTSREASAERFTFATLALFAVKGF